MDTDKLGYSEKTKVLGDGSSGLIGGLFKECTDIYDSDISENESTLENWEKDLTLSLKA